MPKAGSIQMMVLGIAVIMAAVIVSGPTAAALRSVGVPVNP